MLIVKSKLIYNVVCKKALINNESILKNNYKTKYFKTQNRLVIKKKLVRVYGRSWIVQCLVTFRKNVKQDLHSATEDSNQSNCYH